MTVITITTEKVHVGNAVTVVFAYDFRILLDQHLEVYLDNILVDTADYSVAGVGDLSGGNIDFTPSAAPGSGVEVKLVRVVPIDQLVDYRPNDPFPADTHESALDKLTMICQEIQTQLDLAPIVDDDTPNDFIMQFGDAATRAGKIWAFDATGLIVIALDQAQDLAYRWANEDEDLVVAKVGGLDRYSAYHWSLKAEAIVSLPLTVPGDLLTYGGSGYTAFPAGDNGQVLIADDTDPKGLGWTTLTANLPAILAGDALKAPVVKADETGYELKVITADILRGAGGWAEDDESGAPAIQTARKTSHGKQLVMRYEVPTTIVEYMAWMNGNELVYIKEHNVVAYNLKVWFGAAVTGTGNIRLRVDVYLYQDDTDMDAPPAPLTATSVDIAVTASADRQEHTFLGLIPKDAAVGVDNEQVLAISISRRDAAVGEFDQALDIYAASLEVAA